MVSLSNALSRRRIMKHYILSATLILAGVWALGSPTFAEVLNATPSQTVRGQIMKVDGQTYVIRDLSGKEVRLHVDSNTMMMDGTQLREGDTITADVTAKGQASYIIPGPSSSNSQGGQNATQTEKPSMPVR
jgi:hypothetical protein